MGLGLLAAVPGTAAAGSQPVKLDAVMVGGNEVPTAGDPDGWGLARVIVEGRQVCWRIDVTNVADPAAAHIHAGPRRVAGPVVVPLDPVDSGCTETTRHLARVIRQHPKQFYVNVHNAEFPAGAVRGQLLD